MEISNSPFLLLFLLIGCFEGCVWLRAYTKSQLVNPTLITTIVMISVLMLLDIQWHSFEKASNYLSFWLQPAVVCLAVPLYIQWQKIRAQWLAIIISQVIGSCVGIVSGVGIVKMLGGSYQIAVASASKSVTMPIAIDITKALDVVVGISAAAVLIAGVVGQVMGVVFLRWITIRRPTSQGLAMGAASHALGAVRVMQMGQRYVAYATVGLILNGVFTTFLAPVIVPWMV